MYATISCNYLNKKKRKEGNSHFLFLANWQSWNAQRKKNNKLLAILSQGHFSYNFSSAISGDAN
jgi:hypothetical protein